MELRLGTWDVRSLYETAAAKCLVDKMEKCGIQILAIQEARWKDGTAKVGDYNFFYSGGQRHFLGVGFAVHKNLRDKIMEFRPINDMICVIRIKTKFFNLSLINVHAKRRKRRSYQRRFL